MRPLLVMAALAACGEDGSGPPPAGDGPELGRPPSARMGEVRVFESRLGWGPEPSAYASATFVPGGIPVLQAEVMAEGDCRLLEYTPGTCDPPCEPFTAGCSAEGQCVPYAASVSAGTLTVSGLDVPLSMSFGPGGYAGGSIGPELFAAGDVVTVDASGGDVPAFSLEARGVATMEGTPPTVLPASGDATIAYGAAPGSGARVRLTLLSEYAHGAPYASIVECDAGDTGSIVIPAAIAQRYPGPGNCGRCPSSTLLRYTWSMTTVAGENLLFFVGSELPFASPTRP